MISGIFVIRIVWLSYCIQYAFDGTGYALLWNLGNARTLAIKLAL